MTAKPNSVAEWFAGKSLADLEVIEHEGRRFYAESIKRRDPKTGTVVEQPVLLRTPDTTTQALARQDALAWAQKLTKSKAPLKISEAEAILGASIFEDMDTVCLLARCTFKREMPGAMYRLYEFFEEGHTKAAIYELFARLDFYMLQEDPRAHAISEEEAWQAVGAIARVRHCGPLVAIAGSARDSFITFMASRLHSYRTLNAGSPSTETSSPGA